MQLLLTKADPLLPARHMMHRLKDLQRQLVLICEPPIPTRGSPESGLLDVIERVETLYPDYRPRLTVFSGSKLSRASKFRMPNESAM
jgi:hypothetical protein